MQPKISLFDAGILAKSKDELYTILNQVYREIKQEYKQSKLLGSAMAMAGMTNLERLEYLRLCGWWTIWTKEGWFWLGSPLTANDLLFIKQLTTKDITPENIHLRANINLIPNHILIPAGRYALKWSIEKDDKDFWVKAKDRKE